jgi:dipeptidyl aminopeptidase/acylaminoacyl peptidase
MGFGLAAHPLCSAEPKPLTSDGRLKFAPAFIFGGKEVVFSVHNVPKRVSLMRLRLADGKQQLLYPSINAHQFDAAFSKDGRYHCFAMSSTSPQLVLVIKDAKADKSESAAIVQFGENDANSAKERNIVGARIFKPQGARSTVRTPRFLPDQSRVVFTLSAPGGQQIASVNIRGEDLKKLTQSAGTNCWPSVSPDGKRIAFSSSRQGSFCIYVMNADGSDVQRLTDSPTRDIRPAWSPNGEQIAFASARDGNLEIYVMDADGSNLRRLTNHPERDDYPIWHPDGRRLLTVSERAGRFDLYLWDVTDEQ